LGNATTTVLSFGAAALTVLPMANDDHVALLKKGVDAWHEWRRANPHIRPDLSGAMCGA